ncbi:lipid-A-disaccharide kinase [Sinobacterium caligoides]|uniref:Tetraacyldisaccharide 4'-kinase n=1 Tax=Sinobacterium caligoides TaxID=933926 RepID=A0A3N2DKP5_9GAMM|nr:tetraacyldisaccharide 4'-kinase [Sinobacterium caligoides]ROS00282.1 lipid-A-disaccharide kinase [Sinobacterium caligoides]
MKRLQEYWYDRSSSKYLPVRLLKPLSSLVAAVAHRRLVKATSVASPVPVIVVGNLSVGGTGKTPVTVYLVELLRRQGFNPGVISRGYGGKAPSSPFDVQSDSLGAESGDEPLLIARRCGCPVVVDPVRPRALSFLLAKYSCDVVISDDGLQHHALARDVEIVVIDGARGLGNGLCLPAGPLRESADRLTTVDFILHNSRQADLSMYCLDAGALPPQHVFGLNPGQAVHCLSGRRVSLSALPQLPTVAALAGIGHPQRFFTMLEGLGVSLQATHAFVDHHQFRREDLASIEGELILMTEKDAVKCRDFADERCWYVPIEAVFDDSASAIDVSFDQQITAAVTASASRKVI